MTSEDEEDPRFLGSLGHRPILGLLSTADRLMRGMREALLQPFGILTTEYALLVGSGTRVPGRAPSSRARSTSLLRKSGRW